MFEDEIKNILLKYGVNLIKYDISMIYKFIAKKDADNLTLYLLKELSDTEYLRVKEKALKETEELAKITSSRKSMAEELIAMISPKIKDMIVK